jgi:GNAT superfamily N-acetyltransferase
LPQGFAFAAFHDGDEHDWAEIESAVGEFKDPAAALACLRRAYLALPGEAARRVFFAVDSEGRKVGTGSVWWTYSGERRVPNIGWFGVRPDYQGLSLGKALIFHAMERLLAIEGDCDAVLQTQTWSYRAIGIYLEAGFRIMKTGTVAGCANEFEQALPYLAEKMGPYLGEDAFTP